EDLELQKMEFEASKRDLRRREEILDAQSKVEKTKYLAEAEKVEGEVKADLLEKQQRARAAGEAKLIETQGDQVAKIAEVRNRENKKAIEKEIAKLKQKLDEFDTLLAEGKISSKVYETRVTRIENELREYEKRL
ncbi:MAG: hypothetical protein ACFFDB_13370, partial [Promethearchaeota archaeon]